MLDDQQIDFSSPGDIPSESGSPGAPPDPSATPPGYGDPSAGRLPPGREGGPSGYDAPGYAPPGSPGSGGPASPGYAPPGTTGGWSAASGPYGSAYGPRARHGRRPGRGFRAAVGVAIFAVLGIVTFMLVTWAIAASQATSLLNKATTAVDSSAGVDYVSTTTLGGGTTVPTTGDAGQNDGTQTDTEPTAFGTEQFDVLLASNQILYFEGNAPALEDQLGVPASAAPGLAGQWIFLTPGESPYSLLESGLTVPGAVMINDFTATSSGTVTGGDGTTLTEIDGDIGTNEIGTSANSTLATFKLDISPSTNLPTSLVVTDATGVGNTVTTFTNWGTPPSVNVPATAVAWLSLDTSPPPGGYGSQMTPSSSATALAIGGAPGSRRLTVPRRPFPRPSTTTTSLGSRRPSAGTSTTNCMPRSRADRSGTALGSSTTTSSCFSTWRLEGGPPRSPMTHSPSRGGCWSTT